jgi:molecular chaperone GrpE
MAKESKHPHEAEEPILDENAATAETAEAEAPEVAADPAEEIQALKDQNLRLYAEFENFRRRNARERLDLMAILPVVDDFERALKNIPADSAERVGLELIYTKLLNTLKAEGLKEMDNATGQAFDVETMEAITNIPAPSPDLAGKVVDQIEKGYLLGEKIIRYAKVVVGESLAS